MRYFELRGEGSYRFWRISVSGTRVVTEFGRIGSQGQRSEKPFPSKAAALKEHDRAILEKTRKGYVEATRSSSKEERPILLGGLYGITSYLPLLLLDVKAAAAFWNEATANDLRNVSRAWPLEAPKTKQRVTIGPCEGVGLVLSQLVRDSPGVLVYRIADRIVLLDGVNQAEATSDDALEVVTAPVELSKKVGDFAFGEILGIINDMEAFDDLPKMRAKISVARKKGATTLFSPSEALPSMFVKLAPAPSHTVTLETKAGKLVRAVICPKLGG